MFAWTDREHGLLGNIIAGVIGGVVGGWVFSLFGGAGVTGFNFWSFVVAVVGAVIVLFIWKAISGRTTAP